MAPAAPNSNLIFGIPGITITKCSSHASPMCFPIVLNTCWLSWRLFPKVFFDFSKQLHTSLIHVIHQLLNIQRLEVFTLLHEFLWIPPDSEWKVWISMESNWLEPQPFWFPIPWKFPLFIDLVQADKSYGMNQPSAVFLYRISPDNSLWFFLIVVRRQVLWEGRLNYHQNKEASWNRWLTLHPSQLYFSTTIIKDDQIRWSKILIYVLQKTLRCTSEWAHSHKIAWNSLKPCLKMNGFIENLFIQSYMDMIWWLGNTIQFWQIKKQK